MDEANVYDVFVSYSSAHLRWVKQLSGDLEARGLRVWLDVCKLDAGDRWPEDIEAALQASRCVAIVLSGGTYSDGVREELHLAYALKCRIIPVLLDGKKPSGMLSTRQWVDFSAASGYEAALEKLVAGIKKAGHPPGQVKPTASRTAKPPSEPATADEVEALKRHIQRTREDASKLNWIRLASILVGLIPAAGFASFAADVSALGMSALLLSAPATTSLIGWAVTQTRVVALRDEVRRCVLLLDGLEICRVKFDKRCPRFLEQFWAIIEKGVFSGRLDSLPENLS